MSLHCFQKGKRGEKKGNLKIKFTALAYIVFRIFAIIEKHCCILWLLSVMNTNTVTQHITFEILIIAAGSLSFGIKPKAAAQTHSVSFQSLQQQQQFPQSKPNQNDRRRFNGIGRATRNLMDS